MTAVRSPERSWESGVDTNMTRGILRVHRRLLARGGEQERSASTLRDLVELTKPNITIMNVLMTAGAMALAPGGPSLATVLLGLLGTALAVGSANALNMVLERETDRLMKRTRLRPLPDGRLSPVTATLFGTVLGALAIPVLGFGVNGLTALLGAIALVGYVFVYTPLKRRTALALVVGAVPGAMPPLMGWTAVTGQIDPPGFVLFGILMVWQLPHFLAISIYLGGDYARAGIKTVPLSLGVRAAKWQALAYTTILVPLSVHLVPLGVAGGLYLAAAVGLGAWFWSVGLRGLRPQAGTQWARRFFLVSIIYLPSLVVALAADALIGL